MRYRTLKDLSDWKMIFCDPSPNLSYTSSKIEVSNYATRNKSYIQFDCLVPGVYTIRVTTPPYRHVLHSGIAAAEFLCGKAEDALPKVLENRWLQMKGEVVGVVDPPRNGLRTSSLDVSLHH